MEIYNNLKLFSGCFFVNVNDFPEHPEENTFYSINSNLYYYLNNKFRKICFDCDINNSGNNKPGHIDTPGDYEYPEDDPTISIDELVKLKVLSFELSELLDQIYNQENFNKSLFTTYSFTDEEIESLDQQDYTNHEIITFKYPNKNNSGSEEDIVYDTTNDYEPISSTLLKVTKGPLGIMNPDQILSDGSAYFNRINYEGNVL